MQQKDEEAETVAKLREGIRACHNESVPETAAEQGAISGTVW